jgi:hypothetical protein
MHNRLCIADYKINKNMKKNILIIIVLLITFNVLYSQTVAVDLVKMKVLYVGVENPIRIAVENYPCDNIIVKPTHGIIIRTLDNCHYYYKTDSCSLNNEIIFVGVIEGKTIKWLDTIEYRVKRIPDPRLLIASRYGGLIKKEDFINSSMIAHLQGFDFENIANFINYSYEIRRNDSLIWRETDIRGNVFTEKLKKEILSSQKGDKYLFFDMHVEMSADKCIRQIQSAEYEIE